MGHTPDASLSQGADLALRHTFPECALTDVMDAQSPDSFVATRALLRASGAAYASGELVLSVPPVLTGGRLGWDASAGAVRRELVSRLDQLVSTGRLQRRDAAAVIARFGLDGQPGSAEAARKAINRRRQAASDAVNRAVRAAAADISAQPLMPLDAPHLDVARRQVIVGSVLSLMHGRPNDFAMRLYAHMRVRAELLGDPVFPVGRAGPTERQRRRRLANQWLAIAADHLDRDCLPFDRTPSATPDDHASLRAWRLPAGAESPPSIGAIRALVADGEASAFAGTSDVQGVLGFLLDGYRPLVELLRVAHWAHATQASSSPWNAIEPERADALRAGAVLSVADLLAFRGYGHAAVLYAGLGQITVRRPSLAAWLRFRRLIVMEGISYLNGPASIDRTREWHQALVDHLDQHGPGHAGEPLAAAHAIIRAEHAAWTAGVASGATVDELLAPLGDGLDDALRRSPKENRRRFEIVRSRFAGLTGGEGGPTSTVDAGPALTSRSPELPARQDRFDEWYCAYPTAVARWDHRGNPRGRDEWRR